MISTSKAWWICLTRSAPPMRQHNREALHRLDARNLPEWVYLAAKKIGYRIPQEWLYVRNARDWPHIDCGTKKRTGLRFRLNSI